MPSFSISNPAPPRFEGDFLIVPDPNTPPAGPVAAYLSSLAAALESLAADETRDAAANYPAELLAGRRSARKAAASDLKADAQKVAGGQLAADAALARVAQVTDQHNTHVPKFGTADRMPARFDNDFQIVLAADYIPGAADQIYLDNIEKALAEAAADEAKDPTGNFSPSVIATRKSLRSAFAKLLRSNVAECCGGGLSTDAADKVLITRGRYQGRRDRLTSRLFNVKLVPQGEQSKPERECAIDVDIKLIGGLPAPEDTASTEKQELFVQINKTNTVIQTVCRRMRERAEGKVGHADQAAKDRARILLDEYMTKLQGIAVIGLEMSYPALAKLALIEVRNEFFAQEAGRIKNKYVRWLGAWAGVVAIAFLAAYVAIETKYPGWVWAHEHKTFLLAACGASIGTWASFSARQVQFSFDDLLMLEEDSLDPPVRVLFVVSLTLTACLLFWTGAINLEIGNLKTQSAIFKNSGAVAFLIGIFAGLSERALATAISGRAAAFVKGIAGVG